METPEYLLSYAITGEREVYDVVVDEGILYNNRRVKLKIEYTDLPKSAKEALEMYSGIGSFKEHPTKEQVIHVLRWLGGDKEVEPPNYE